MNKSLTEGMFRNTNIRTNKYMDRQIDRRMDRKTGSKTQNKKERQEYFTDRGRDELIDEKMYRRTSTFHSFSYFLGIFIYS